MIRWHESGWLSFKDFNTLIIPKDSITSELESWESKVNNHK